MPRPSLSQLHWIASRPRAARHWSKETSAANAEYRAFTDAPVPQPGEMNLSTMMIWLRDHLPDDAIITNGAGGFAAWIHRFYRFRRMNTHFAPVSQSMGYGVPAAVALTRLYPGPAGGLDQRRRGFPDERPGVHDRRAIWPAHHRAGAGQWHVWLIRLHQERTYPGRVSATTLTNPDFALWAKKLRWFRPDRDQDQRFRGCFQGRASIQPAGADPCEI